MDSRIHFYSSTLLSGCLYTITQSPQITISGFLSGILIDIDHVFDFLVFSKDKISIKNLFSWCNEGKWEKIIHICHSYEFYLLLCVITYYSPNNIQTGILFGGGLHLILDQIGNCYLKNKFRLSPWFYFLTYRAFVNFNKEKLCTDI